MSARTLSPCYGPFEDGTTGRVGLTMPARGDRAAHIGVGTGAFTAERDDWSAAIGRAAAEGWRILELAAVTESRFRALGPHLSENPGQLSAFARVSVHAPSSFDSSPAEVVAAIPDAIRRFTLVCHPDVFRDVSGLAELGDRIVFENMDVQKPFGRTVSDLRETFARFPEAGFCLDVAHVWTNDPTLTLGRDLLDAFGERLRQVHLSGIEPDGAHRPTRQSDFDLYEPLLALCTGVPWILETEIAD